MCTFSKVCVSARRNSDGWRTPKTVCAMGEWHPGTRTPSLRREGWQSHTRPGGGNRTGWDCPKFSHKSISSDILLFINAPKQRDPYIFENAGDRRTYSIVPFVMEPFIFCCWGLYFLYKENDLVPLAKGSHVRSNLSFSFFSFCSDRWKLARWTLKQWKYKFKR